MRQRKRKREREVRGGGRKKAACAIEEKEGKQAELEKKEYGGVRRKEADEGRVTEQRFSPLEEEEEEMKEKGYTPVLRTSSAPDDVKIKIWSAAVLSVLSRRFHGASSAPGPAPKIPRIPKRIRSTLFYSLLLGGSQGNPSGSLSLSLEFFGRRRLERESLSHSLLDSFSFSRG